MRMAVAHRLPDRGAVETLRDTTGLATIVVHLDRLPDAQRAAWETALAAGRSDFVSIRSVGRFTAVVDLAP